MLQNLLNSTSSTLGDALCNASNRPNNLFSQAFHRWETVHAQLIQTIQLHLEACVTLNAACSELASHSHLPEESYRRVDAGLLELLSNEVQLTKSRTMLTKIRNRSRTLSPISRLPSEILVAIFSMASNECRNTCFTPARSLPNPKAPPFAIVCAQWRQLYLRWHVASSHLDLIVGGSVADAYYHYAEARAANSIDAPIHLSIRDWVNKSVNAKAVSVDEVAKLISFVTPLLPRVCAIDITFKFRSQRLLDSVVSSWAKCGSSILPKVFKVWNTSESGPLELKAPTESPTEFRDFFSPLQTLALYNCTIASDTSVYRGLVDLRIDWLHNDASPLNITDILAASPNLRSLAVEDVEFVELGENIEMIPLMSLQNISVSQSKIENSLKHLLPLLDTGSNSTNVIMRVILQPDFIPESRAFFLRSSVKRIFTYGNERYHHSIVASLCPAPDLQELVLRDCSLKYDPDEDSSITDENGNTCTPWPLLHTLYLVGCTFEFEALRKFVLSHPMRKLRVYNGYIQPDVRRKMKPEECEELEGMFSQTGIDVKCVQDEVDCPTRLNFFDGLYA